MGPTREALWVCLWHPYSIQFWSQTLVLAVAKVPSYVDHGVLPFAMGWHEGTCIPMDENLTT